MSQYRIISTKECLMTFVSNVSSESTRRVLQKMEEDKLSITKYTRGLKIKLTITKEKSAGYQNDIIFLI